MTTYDLSMAQKAIYKALSEGVKPKTGSSADFIRNIIRYGYQTNRQNKLEINEKIKRNNENLSKQRADEDNAKIQHDGKVFTSDIQTVLRKCASETFSAKRNAVTQFVKQMPSDSLNRKLQYIQNYGHLFDKTVWEIFIKDTEIASNYFASKITEKLAEENGIDYVISFDPTSVFEKIDSYETMVNTAIARIDDDDDIIVGSLISENPDNPVSKLINDLDSDISTIIPEEKRTVMKRLKDAEKHAYDNDNIGLSARIKVFMERNIHELSTPEELKDELFQQAESYISQGMPAKKGNE